MKSNSFAVLGQDSDLRDGPAGDGPRESGLKETNKLTLGPVW